MIESGERPSSRRDILAHFRGEGFAKGAIDSSLQTAAPATTGLDDTDGQDDHLQRYDAETRADAETASVLAS